jgi:hypothetical protein
LLGEPDIGARLGDVSSGHGSTEDGDADRTPSYAVGTATSAGQRFRVRMERLRANRAPSGGLKKVTTATKQVETLIQRQAAQLSVSGNDTEPEHVARCTRHVFTSSLLSRCR